MNLWQLTQSNARLNASSLQATVDLLNPALGMHGLRWNGQSISGELLGVVVAEESSPPTPLSTEGIDRYVRGNDLVANYPQSQSQRFTLQVYWRVTANSADMLVIDTIVSLQTSLLECFPRVELTTKLPEGNVVGVARDHSPPLTIADHFASDEPAAVLVRCNDQPWAYFEMTHPTDLGIWRVTRGGGVELQRELGGEFQEKGVIRRLRVRGAFVARENDEQIARQILTEFAESEPPLTA